MSRRPLRILGINPGTRYIGFTFLNRLRKRIKDLARRRRMKVCELSIEELERFFSPERKINRREMAEMVALRYPELLCQLERERNHRNPYHIRTFEAVALGLVCLQHVKE
jgi:hypothetical protein